MKYKAHIVSHSHWDREWYLPYEKHHLRLINLIDEILDEIDKNPSFGSFHLDGQTIIIEDYLQIKPNNRDRLLKAIQLGKIKIGPWFILQDAYLTSSEANIRNLQIGNIDCKNYGSKTNIGYFPDTFGIYAQAGQILKKANIDNMFFGRGVTPTGFNNQVSNDFDSKFSEMRIEAPNGDEVIGILFANWYSNGDNIPVNKEKAKTYWDQKLQDVKRFTKNKNLLFMNGCDHTPLQPNITQAIEIANSLYEDVEFVHSSLEQYLEEVKKELKTDELSVIKKELRSQDTDGYYTLVNTLSSRIYQKQQNVEIQDMYEQVVEPLSTMILDKNKYDTNKIIYGWKTLMKNHPHDSICGCSCDEVHDLMDTRFMRAKNVALGIIDETLYYYRENVKKEDEQKEFTVFNTTSTSKKEVIEIIIDYDKEYFGEDFNQNRKNLENKGFPNLNLKDKDGQLVKAIITDLGVHFGYDLPKDQFRKSYYSRKLKIEFEINIDRFSWETYTLEEVNSQDNKYIENIKQNNGVVTTKSKQKHLLENEYIKIEITKDSKINFLNKKLNIEYKNILEIVDEGDIGNEYMFGAVKGDKDIRINSIQKIEVYENILYQSCKIHTSITLPISAKNTFLEEKRKLIEYYKRETQREDKTIEIPLVLTLKLENNSNKLDLNIKFTNTCKDHRMRFKFNLKTMPKEIYADGVFEITKRGTETTSSWKNPNNDQPMQKFISILEQDHNLIVATKGLHEYEVKDNSLYITLLRSISEMGDWGDFPTPKAQCLKTIDANISIIIDDKENRFKNYNKLRNNFIKLPYTMIYKNAGKINKNNNFINIRTDDKVHISSLKRNEKLETCLRMFSNGNTSKIDIQEEYTLCNLLEEEIKDKEVKEIKEIKEGEIVTIKIKNK